MTYNIIHRETGEGVFDPYLAGNEAIEEAIAEYGKDQSREKLAAVVNAIHERMVHDGHFMIPVVRTEDNAFAFRFVETEDQQAWPVVFTSMEEYGKGEESTILSNYMDTTLKACLESEVPGIAVNPWGESLFLTKKLIEMMFEAER